MAPEIVQRIEYNGILSDIWTLGILLYILLTGHFPFAGKDDNEIFKKILKCEIMYATHVST